MKRAVITGGAGFIGSNLLDVLIKDDVNILVIDNLATGSLDNLREARQYHDRLRLLEADITSREARDEIVSYKPEIVFHFAAQINVRKSVEEPAFDSDSNVTGTVSMLEAARLSGSSRFIFASTGGAIYGEQEHYPALEDHPIKPKSPYGVSKRAAEMYLEYYARYSDLSTVSMRFANVYGPRQNAKGEAGVIAIFTERLLAGENLRINGDGSQTRDYIYVSEVVDACLRAAKKDPTPKFDIYNVGRGQESSVNDITALLKELSTSAKIEKVRVSNGPALKGEQQRSVISSAKLSRELGWKSTIDLKSGLALTFNSFLNK